MIQDVKRCARCAGDHSQILFTKLGGQKVEGVTHWGMCPTLNQPILMEVREKATAFTDPADAAAQAAAEAAAVKRLEEAGVSDYK